MSLGLSFPVRYGFDFPFSIFLLSFLSFFVSFSSSFSSSFLLFRFSLLRTLSSSGSLPKRAPLLSGKASYALGARIGEKRIGVGTDRRSPEATRSTTLDRCDADDDGDDDEEWATTKVAHVRDRRGGGGVSNTTKIPIAILDSSQSDAELEYAEVSSALVGAIKSETTTSLVAFSEKRIEATGDDANEVNYASEMEYEQREAYSSNIYNNLSNNGYANCDLNYELENSFDFGLGEEPSANVVGRDDTLVACFNRLQSDRVYDPYVLCSPEKENISLSKMSYYFNSSNNNSNNNGDSGSQELSMSHQPKPKSLFCALSFVPDSPEKSKSRSRLVGMRDLEQQHVREF
jgi:hypothetical protein